MEVPPHDAVNGLVAFGEASEFLGGAGDFGLVLEGSLGDLAAEGGGRWTCLQQ